ncbi:MAG: hypothetical protein FJ293_07000 [Planctomycetes bacterium]|nr:hypothetical protein [Planctomycetota bacterium]
MSLSSLAPFALTLAAALIAPANDLDRDMAKGRAALLAGRYDEASQLLEQALHADGKDARAFALLARARCALAEQQAQGDGDDAAATAETTIARAEEAGRSAIELAPRDPEAWAALGHVLVRSGKFSEAIDTLYHAERLGNPGPELLIDLSDGLLMAREFCLQNDDDGGARARLADAEAALERASAVDAAQVAVWRRRAEIAAAKGEHVGASRSYRKAISLAPADTTLHEAHLKVVGASQAFVEAQDFLTGLVDEPAVARWYRSRVHELAGHVAFNKDKDFTKAAAAYQDAEKDMKEAAKRDPGLRGSVDGWLPTLRTFRGRALTSAAKYADAEAALLSALDLDKTHAEALAALHELQDAMWKKHGGEAMKPEQMEEVRALASKLALVEPGNAANWNNWAFFAREVKKYEESWQAYRRAIELDPDNPTYLNDAALIQLYHLGRDTDRAEGYLHRAIELASAVVADDQRTSADKAAATIALGDAYGNLINVFSQSDRKEQAIALLRELEKKLPKRSEVAYWKERLLPDEWKAEQDEKAAAADAKGEGKVADADADADAEAEAEAEAESDDGGGEGPEER